MNKMKLINHSKLMKLVIVAVLAMGFSISSYAKDAAIAFETALSIDETWQQNNSPMNEVTIVSKHQDDKGVYTMSTDHHE